MTRVDGAILAHGVGSRQDLPLPFGLAVAGAAAALVLTFVLLGVLWRTPQLNGARAGRPVSPWLSAALDSAPGRRLQALLGAVLAGYAAIGLLLGRDDARNPTPFVIYVLLWVGLVPVSVLLGPVWRRLNPVRHAHAAVLRLARVDPREGLVPLPAGLGYWPAAAGLLAFSWLELIAPGRATLPVLRLVVTGYVAIQLVAGLVFGSRWFDRGDPFEVWSALYGRLSPLGRRDDGRLVVRSPLAGLDALAPAPGLAATVVVMLGGTAYDGASNAPAWFTLVQTAPLPQTLTQTLGLLAIMGLVGAVFAGCTRLAGALSDTSPGTPGRVLTGQFAPSLVPIALGYVVAHYWSLLVLEGQNAFIRLSDPLGTGADWLGLGHRSPDPTLLQPTLVATIQVLAVVVGHVLGVVLAHDRAVRLFPGQRAVVGQLPLLAMMVAYTCCGLLVLFSA
jgi:hypothetical protein